MCLQSGLEWAGDQSWGMERLNNPEIQVGTSYEKIHKWYEDDFTVTLDPDETPRATQPLFDKDLMKITPARIDEVKSLLRIE